MSFFSIRIEPSGLIVQARAQTPLTDILNDFGLDFPCGGKGTCKKCKVKLQSGFLDGTPIAVSQNENINLESNWYLACKSKVISDACIEIDQWEHIILNDNSSFDFEPKNELGIAIDLGSTTIVAQLVDMMDGRIIAFQSAINRQTAYGSDIISRIEFALQDKDGKLSLLIRNQIAEMVLKLEEKAQKKITRAFIVGNSVMHHFFCEHDIKPLSSYPFESPNNTACQIQSQELTNSFSNNYPIEFQPNIGSFVGSDILAGIIATGIYQSDNYQVLIDLGTNGEIVVGNRERILCASTAAGPAFEGANISIGMRATTGAIASIHCVSDAFECKIIGNTEAKGICGSGLIDAVACGLKLNKIDETGNLAAESMNMHLNKNLFLNQSDIREYQLAKAAIATGIEILLNELKITNKDIEHVYLAGGFGNFVNVNNAIQTGLLEFDESKIIKAGNSALAGTKIMLFKDNQFVDEVLKKCTHISLESKKEFQDIFIDKMFFL